MFVISLIIILISLLVLLVLIENPQRVWAARRIRKD